MNRYVYRGLEDIPLGLIGFGIQESLLVHMFAITIEHIDRAHVILPLGLFRDVFHSPQMHLWHHARKTHAPYRISFGLTPSLWGWLLKTACGSADDPDIERGFEDVQRFPSGFFGQMGGLSRSLSGANVAPRDAVDLELHTEQL